MPADAVASGPSSLNAPQISAHPDALTLRCSKPLAAAELTTMKCSTDKRSAPPRTPSGRRSCRPTSGSGAWTSPTARRRPASTRWRRSRPPRRAMVSRARARDGGPRALEGPRAGLIGGCGCDKIVLAADVGGFGSAARAAVARPRPRAARLPEQVRPPPRRRCEAAPRPRRAPLQRLRDPARRRADSRGPRARRLPPRGRGSCEAALRRHAAPDRAPARAGLPRGAGGGHPVAERSPSRRAAARSRSTSRRRSRSASSAARRSRRRRPIGGRRRRSASSRRHRARAAAALRHGRGRRRPRPRRGRGAGGRRRGARGGGDEKPARAAAAVGCRRPPRRRCRRLTGCARGNRRHQSSPAVATTALFPLHLRVVLRELAGT